jgi:recombinational DNA repair ATPase RecF
MKKFKVQKVRNIKEQEVVFDEKMSILMKDNAHGKTSFLKALDFALSGNFDKADIMDGEDSAFVEVTLKSGVTFSREVFRDKPTKIKYNGKTCTAKALEENLATLFDIKHFDDFKVLTSGNMAKLNSTELSA